MKNNDFLNTAKRICSVILILCLILGIFSSAFGVTVMAMSKGKNKAGTPENTDPDTAGEAAEEEYRAPTEDYPELENQMVLSDQVIVFTQEQCEDLEESLQEVSSEDYYGTYISTYTLEGQEHDALKDLYRNDIIYWQDDDGSVLGGDRIMKIYDVNRYGGKTYLKVTEPYPEEVFESLGINASDALTEENFVRAYYAKGVTSHFGNIDTDMDMMNTTTTTSGGAPKGQIQTLGSAPQLTAGSVLSAKDSQVNHGDLIIEINYDMSKNTKDKNNDGPADVSYGIKGQFGIRDLTSHVICDIPDFGQFEEMYVGLSGQTFIDVDFYGQVEAKAEPEATEKDTWLVKFEGLNEKRFPIAIFEFKGTTPVKISQKAFDSRKESLIPSLFLVVYADWEGKISLSIDAGFELTDSFNSGLRIFREGQLALSFENYPYTTPYEEAEDGFSWNAEVTLDAEVDVTLLGASALFYVAGVNICEVSAARIGIQAKCNATISASSTEGLKVIESDETDFFIRGYLKILEAKVKLKAEGKSFLKGLSIDVNFEFALVDITLFETGLRPDKFKTKVPISSMKPPTEFESVITIVFDVSGSMGDTIGSGQTKLQAAQDASLVIINTTEDWAKTSEGNYGIGIVSFSSGSQTVAVPHIDYKYLGECVGILKAGGDTNISSGINTAVSQLESVKCSNKVIILMTDGQDYNESSIRDAAKKANSAGIEIQTIGFGNDVDEDLLRDVANITGGEYQFADTSTALGIIKSFMRAQQSSNADLLADKEGTVAEGETSSPTTFTVDDQGGDLVVTTAWPGSFLDTILTDPTGRVVDEDYPGAVTDESKIPSTITVKNPIKGKWTVKVKGIECSYEHEPFYTIVAFREAKSQKLNTAMSDIQVIAAYCLPIGIFTTLASALLLACLKTKKKKR